MGLGLIGIDPGKSGGIAYRTSEGIELGKIGDLINFQRYLKDCKKNTPRLICFIEKVSAWPGDADNPGKAYRISKMTGQYNQLIATLTLLEIPFKEVPSRTWQSYLKNYHGVNKKKFKNPKNAYKAFAIENYPKLLRQINLNTADALCIMFYGVSQVRKAPTEYQKLISISTGYV